MLDAWLDLVHGAGCVGCPRPGRALCDECAQGLPKTGVPVRPTPCPAGLAVCFAAGEYAGLLRAMILAHKEHGAFSLSRPLGHVLARVVLAALPAAELPGAAGPAATVLVPVPSRPSVVRARGHDPMLRIARTAAVELRRSGRSAAVRPALAVRATVADQAGLTSAQRAANLAGSMLVRSPARESLARLGVPVSVVVCDDVLTTGATAREAQRALEEAGVRVRAVATVTATRRLRPSRPVADPPSDRGLPNLGQAH